MLETTEAPKKDTFWILEFSLLENLCFLNRRIWLFTLILIFCSTKSRGNIRNYVCNYNFCFCELISYIYLFEFVWIKKSRIRGHLDPQQLDFAKGWIDVSGDPLAQVDASWWKCDIPWVWAPPDNSDHQDSYSLLVGDPGIQTFICCYYCWWLKSGDHHLRYIIYPSI